MRITSGILKNRRFEVPKLEVRPTKGQVREAIFSSLGGNCEGWNVLDLFAGSGSLGLEAWSRGADSVTLVEQHAQVYRTLEANVKSLRNDALGKIQCRKGDATKYTARTHGEQFDLIFVDPPYDLNDAMELVLTGVVEHSVLTPDGRLVYELRAKDRFTLPDGWEILREKVYGYTRILILKLDR